MTINIIYAASTNNVIGKDGGIPWLIPEDIRRFKEMTAGGVVIMGRKTWDSLPVKPLRGRINVVLSSQDIDLQGAIVLKSMDKAMEVFSDILTDVWIIGGASVIEEGFKHASGIFLTRVLEDVEGDSHAPAIPEDYVLMSLDTDKFLTSKSGAKYIYQYYGRVVPEETRHV